jgi:small-conductance mechanosensitive channel
MKTLRNMFLSIVLLGSSAVLPASLPVFGTLEEAGRKLLPIELATKKAEQLEGLKKEKLQLEDSKKEFLDRKKGILNEIGNQIESVKGILERDPDNDFFVKELSLFNQRQQVLRDQEQERDQLTNTLDQHIKILQEYLLDPQLENYQKKEIKIAERPVYSYADLQILYEQTVRQKRRLAQLEQKEKNIAAQLENRKKTAAAAAQEFKKKQEEFEKNKKTHTYIGDGFEFSLQQQEDLFKLEQQLYEDQKELDDLRQRIIERQIDMITSQMFIERAQRDIIKEVLRRVKPAIRVSESEITQAKDALARRKQQLFKDKEPIRQELQEVSEQIKTLEVAREELSKKDKIPLGADIDDWSREPRQSLEMYMAFIQVASLNTEMLQLQSMKALHETRLALEDEKIRLDSVKVEVQESFYLLSSKKDLSEDDIKREVKEYDKPRAEVEEHTSLYTELRSGTEAKLESQKRALDAIIKLKERVTQHKNTMFRSHGIEYQETQDLLAKAEQQVKLEIETLTKVLSNYGDILGYLANVGKDIEFITAELNGVVLWQRPEVAISWSDIQTIMPELHLFITGLQNYLSGFDIGIVIAQIRGALATPLDIALAILLLAFIIIGIWVVRLYAPLITARLKVALLDKSGLSLFMVMLFDFVVQHIISVSIWGVLFGLLHLYTMPDVYYYVIFYLLSIPYLLYLAHRFIDFFMEFNEEMGYPFVAQDFQGRIELVLATLLYATIVILFFREAFILVSAGPSKLPIILLAFNFIILQISLILILSKEQILSIIPDHRPFWQWVHAQVNKYYYIIISFVIAMIVMSNPYVGFGFLVRHILRKSIYTALSILILYHIHMMIKRRISYIFFDVEQDVVRERFGQSKTWYGATVIALFFIFIFVGIVVCAHIWDWPETLASIKSWADVQELLKTSIMFKDTTSPISVNSLLQILMFFVIGSILSFAMNHFVLAKIFDVLLVDASVQNAVSSIMRYVILAASIIIGFESVGLHNVVAIILGALLLSIGWIIKDPMADLIAYFIILVQRPLKVGDYIYVDQETLGFVRKITARAVIIRRRNSTTVIIPNTKIISQPIVNWNYVRSFIAFDDIMVTVAHKEDPGRVKELLVKVLDESPYILKSPKPVVRFEFFSDTGFTFLVRGYMSSNYTQEQWDIASDVRIEIVRTLRAHGIEIAVPVRVVYERDGKISPSSLRSRDEMGQPPA